MPTTLDSTSLATLVGKWIDTAEARLLVLFTNVPNNCNMDFMNPARLPYLKITRWGKKATGVVGMCDMRNDTTLCQQGVLTEDYKCGAVVLTYIDDTLKNIRADKVVALSPYIKSMQHISNTLINDTEKLQAYEFAMEELIRSLDSFINP